jgi:hypothetical protein
VSWIWIAVADSVLAPINRSGDPDAVKYRAALGPAGSPTLASAICGPPAAAPQATRTTPMMSALDPVLIGLPLAF